jgi:dihydroorotate dehydrogenase (fumarate)
VTDLRTTYLGLDLRSPLVASAGPLTGDLDSLRRLQDAGTAAVVLPSLFEEQITHDEFEVERVLSTGTESFAEALDYFPDLDDYNTGPESYLGLVEEAKRVLEIPVIASLNGVSSGGWTDYARLLQSAGADAIELNVYFVATDPAVTAPEVEERYIDLVASVRKTIRIPLAVKIGPFFSSMANMAVRLVDAGADGLVLFNRFYQPDIDLETMYVAPSLALSSSHELRLPLRWIAILHGVVEASLAATTGVHTSKEVAKVLLAGADVAMMTSALLRAGPEHVADVEAGLVAWMAEKEYESVSQLRGSMSQRSVPDPAAFERANYMKVLTTFTSRFRQ